MGKHSHVSKRITFLVTARYPCTETGQSGQTLLFLFRLAPPVVALRSRGVFFDSRQSDLPGIVVWELLPHRRPRFIALVELRLYLKAETKTASGGAIGRLGAPGTNRTIFAVGSGSAPAALGVTVPGATRDWFAEVLFVILELAGLIIATASVVRQIDGHHQPAAHRIVVHIG